MTDPAFTHREAESLNQAIRDLTKTLNELRQEMSATYVRKDVLGPQLEEIRADIKSHGDWLLWAQRIVIGAVMLALVGLVVYQGGAIK